jgi:hypothetical protein
VLGDEHDDHDDDVEWDYSDDGDCSDDPEDCSAACVEQAWGSAAGFFGSGSEGA